jgi:hypothetical protein
MSDFKLQRYSLVPPFQIIRRFGFLFLNKRFDFSKYIPFVMYQEINVFRKTKTTSNLKQMDICLFFQLWEHWTQTSLGSMTGYLFICNLLIIVGLILLGEPTSEFLGSRVHLFVIVFSPYKWSHCSAAEELVILLCAGQFGSLTIRSFSEAMTSSLSDEHRNSGQLGQVDSLQTKAWKSGQVAVEGPGSLSRSLQAADWTRQGPSRPRELVGWLHALHVQTSDTRNSTAQGNQRLCEMVWFFSIQVLYQSTTDHRSSIQLPKIRSEATRLI